MIQFLLYVQYLLDFVFCKSKKNECAVASTLAI